MNSSNHLIVRHTGKKTGEEGIDMGKPVYGMYRGLKKGVRSSVIRQIETGSSIKV